VAERMRSDLGDQVGAVLSRISKVQNKMTVQQAMELRTSLGEEVRAVADVLPTRVERILTRLEEAIDKDVEGTLQRMAKDRTINPQTLADARAARGTWADLHRPFMRRITALAQDNPEAVHREWWAARTSVDDLAMAKRVLPPEIYDTLQLHALRSEIVRPFVHSVTFQPEKGSLIGTQRSTLEALKGPEALIDKLAAVDNPRYRAKLRFMVGPELSNDIISDIARPAAERPVPALSKEFPGKIWSPSENRGAMGKILHYALHPGLGLTGGLIGYVRGGLGEATALAAAMPITVVGAEYGLAKLLVSPGARAQLGRLASAGTAKVAHTVEAAAIASALGAKLREYAQEAEEAEGKKKEKKAKGQIVTPPPR
jgi:hypothetical protein